jgi:hypothetical protein
MHERTARQHTQLDYALNSFTISNRAEELAVLRFKTFINTLRSAFVIFPLTTLD